MEKLKRFTIEGTPSFNDIKVQEDEQGYYVAYDDVEELEERIDDALNVIDWTAGLSQEALGKKLMAVMGILKGIMTSDQLRGEGFDLSKLKSEREKMNEALDTMVKRHAEVLDELEQTKARRNDAMRIIEEKRVRIQELEEERKAMREAAKEPRQRTP